MHTSLDVSAPDNIPFEYWIEHVTSDSFMSGLDSLLGCSKVEFQAFQLIGLVVFGAMD